MKTGKRSDWIKIITVVTFIGMITVNALAVTLPLNGVETGAVSDNYANYFAPAGITFSIWSLIYVLLALFILYYTGVIKTTEKSSIDQESFAKIGILFAFTSIVNGVWIVCWHYDLIVVSMVLMVMLLAGLIMIVLQVEGRRFTRRDRLLVHLPFSVYLGWITVATIANCAVMLVSLQWNGAGISPVSWTVIMLCAGMLIGTMTIIRLRNVAYGAVMIWAYAGITLKQVSPSGFAGEHVSIIATAVVGMALFLVAAVYVLVIEHLHHER